MNPDQLLIVFLILAAVIVMICLARMWGADQDAELGRALRQAAGTDERAHQVVEETRVAVALEARLERELEERLTYKRRHEVLGRNVVPFRIVDRGRPLHFEPPGAA